MRVHLVNLNFIRQDATGQCILNHARYFLRRGDDVRIFSMDAPVGVPPEIARLTRIVSHDEVARDPGDEFWRADLYVYQYPTHYPLIETIKQLERGAVIFYYHNVTPPEMWGDDEVAQQLRRSLAAVKDLIRYADLVVTPSPYNAEGLTADSGADPGRVRVLHNAVAVEEFSPGPKRLDLLARYGLLDRRVIGFVGRMAGNKRVDLLIEALPLVRQRVPNAALMLVGDDRGADMFRANVERWRTRAAELGLGDEMIFTGVVDDLPSHVRLMDVYATASLHEGFGVPLVEAMATGVPVVASNATAHPWVVGDAGLLAEPENAADLADKITQVLTDDALCGELVRRGLARARTFSLEHYEIGWGKIVAEATAFLPAQPYPVGNAPAHSLHSVFGAAAASPQPAGRSARDAGPPEDWDRARSVMDGHVKHLDNTADVMIRGYTVRSKVPLVGPLIAWIRRNSTTHLREPYLDPMFERQVAFNRHVAFTLRQLLDSMAALTRQMSASQATPPEREAGSAVEPWLRTISAQLQTLSAQIGQMQAEKAPPGPTHGAITGIASASDDGEP